MAVTPHRPPRLIVCTHGDCRRARGHDRLLALAASVPGSVTVPCQGICDGPVLGVQANGDVRWYKRIRGPSQRALVRLLRGDASPKALREREVRKRRGMLRHRRRLQPLG